MGLGKVYTTGCRTFSRNIGNIVPNSILNTKYFFFFFCSDHLQSKVYFFLSESTLGPLRSSSCDVRTYVRPYIPLPVFNLGQKNSSSNWRSWTSNKTEFWWLTLTKGDCRFWTSFFYQEIACYGRPMIQSSDDLDKRRLQVRELFIVLIKERRS